ncbi:helix-turn-helix transcriptional regulator [Chitinophaga qingshengii]|uniref:Helix-turn-helix transcriptional regulator n=1 Tax=Chitinophaga qingshengii TaxID=1569794 RepID=A0ABR7TTE4_9BACT|nr:helix-turn-helix transcriptional regulator [Chitinophaga qingshengii]MBC9933315.1 helix-turn-helix transcriptional regulator [Chitinophaga qingshengii]
MGKVLLNRIRAVLAEAGLNQKDLFNRINERKKISYNSVTAWCRNDAQPDLATLWLIAEVLNVSVRSLIVDNKRKD